jgi:signal transduction histidine kinase
MTSLRRVKLALAVTIAVFAAAAAYASLTISERQQSLREVSRYNLVWAASQALVELHRFEYRVAAFGLPGSTVDKDEIQLRFDILLNRLTILAGGDLAAFAEDQPEQKAVIEDYAASLRDVEKLLDGIERPGNIRAILDRLASIDTRLTRFAAAANQFGGRQVADDQHQLLRLHWIFSGLAFALVLCGVAFIGLLFLHNRLLHRAHGDLHRMARDLKVAKEAAEAASEAKSRFLANMSHELRTPLNAINGFSEILVGDALGRHGPAKYREYAADILRSGRHMLELVEDILMMAKLEAGRFELIEEVTPLRRVVDSAIVMVRGTEMARGRDIDVEERGTWPALEADQRALRQMLLNLLSNAVKFSPRDTAIRIRCAREASGDLRLTVIDRGIGMSEDEAALAVQPFQQVDSRLARQFEGTGLGLSIVKALIERHGGRLEIDSAPGVGSRIALIFPAHRASSLDLAAVA